jgi:branched-chain amino acid transport system ATP-binding protein
LASNALQASEPAGPLLELTDLALMYGGIVGVQGFDLTVGSGQVVALLGPNGAGKSSVLRAICGEGEASGSVKLDGVDVSSWAPHRRARTGLIQVPQGGGLFREMTVLENLQLGAYGRRRDEREASLQTVFDLFPKVKARQTVLAGMLSGGEQQMLALGRALMGSPKIMLLDEPTIGLAPSAVTEVFERIGLIASTGVSLIIVDQNAVQALKLADWVIIVNRGKIVYSAEKDRAVHDVNIVDAHLGLVAGSEVEELTADAPSDETLATEALMNQGSLGERFKQNVRSFFG